MRKRTRSTALIPKTITVLSVCLFLFAGLCTATGAVDRETGAADRETGAARDDERGASSCLTCKGKGAAPCDRHKKAAFERERETLRCTETATCPMCHGTFLMKCPRCKNAPSAKVKKAWEENQAWLGTMGEIDSFLRKKKGRVVHGESEHFIVTIDVRKLPVGRKGVSTHSGMHLFLERLEKLFSDVSDDLGAEESDFLAKTHVMIWERERDLVNTASKYCHQKSNTKSFLIGAEPVFTIYYNKGYLHEEFELHQAVVHNVVHCLLSNVWDGMWPGNIKGGWLDAGYAHHYELRYFGHLGGVRHYCYREGDTQAKFKFGKWEPSILLLVQRKETLSFIEIASKNTDNLTPMEHMHSWSYVDFILAEHPEKFGSVARLVKQRKPIGEIMKEGMGMSPFAFEEKWQKYVKSTYQLKPKKRKKRN